MMPWTALRRCFALGGIILSSTALAAPDYTVTKVLLGFATGLTAASVYLLEQEERKRNQNGDNK